MLPATARITRAADFRRTTRSGVRIGRPTLVLNASRVPGGRVRVGFVVSKAVGHAVLRNQVKRRLRHLAAERIHAGIGLDVVIRALPAAALHPAAVASDLRSAWDKAEQRLNRAATATSTSPPASGTS